MISEPWVSVEGVARHLGVAKDSVYRWIQARGMPAHKIGSVDQNLRDQVQTNLDYLERLRRENQPPQKRVPRTRSKGHR